MHVAHKECVQDFGREPSWKVDTWHSKETEGNIRLDVGHLISETGDGCDGVRSACHGRLWY